MYNTTGGRVKLTVLDEVNCKFEGLNPSVRREMINAVSFDIPSARHTPAYKLGRWNGKVELMQMGGSTFIQMLDKLVPILDKYGIEIDIEDQRISHQFNFEPIDKDFFSYVQFGVGHHMEGKSIVLHDHQVKAINALLENQQGLLQACTSAGKTLICAATVKCIEKYGRTITIVPSTDLVQQTYNDYAMVGLDTGVFYGDKKEFGHKHTVTTWQSLNCLWKKTKKGDIEMTEQDVHDFISGVVAVIVDEAHGSASEALQAILGKVMHNVPIRLAMTGTIPKDPSLVAKIKCQVGDVVYEIKAKELQEKQILSTCNVNCIRLKSNLKFTTYQDELKFLTTNPDRIGYIADLVSLMSESGNTLVLVDRLECGELLCEKLGIPKSEFIRGNTKKKDREASYGEIRWADNKILIATYGVASTGISISRLYNVVLIEPGKSFIRTIQSIGRGLRKAEDKDHVEIYDISGTNKFSSRHYRERLTYYKEVEYPHSETKADWE